MYCLNFSLFTGGHRVSTNRDNIHFYLLSYNPLPSGRRKQQHYSTAAADQVLCDWSEFSSNQSRRSSDNGQLLCSRPTEPRCKEGR